MSWQRKSWLWIGSLVALPIAAQDTPDGERIYLEHCARCHETAMAQMPTREALASYAPELVENALSTFAMRSEAEELSHAERRAVAEYLTGSPPGTLKAPADAIPASAYCRTDAEFLGDAWNGWGAGLANTRYRPSAAAELGAADVPRLTLKWAFGFPGVTTSGSQATVVGNRVFVGSRNGAVYALDAKTGCLDWLFQADAGVRSTPTVARQEDSVTVYFGDAHAQIYALDAASGELRFKVKIDAHEDAIITGGTAYFGGRLYVPVSSVEESGSIVPTYECCTFRGSLVALDANDGQSLWQTFMVDEPEPAGESSVGTQLYGPSGAAIWSAPTLDPVNNRVYVATGDNYTNPASPMSDAIVALAMDTGRVVWVQQTLPGDAWNVSCMATDGPGVNCPESEGPDFDFGSSPALAKLADGRRVLLAGQKSGVLYGIDPDDGELLWERRVGDGGILGGIEWGFATDGERAYVGISEALEKGPGDAGGMAAFSVEDGRLVWETPPSQTSCDGRPACNTAQPAAVSALEGVAFSGSLDGHLRAYAAGTGEIVWDYDTVREYETVNGVPGRGGAMNGPGAVIAGGMLFVNAGYGQFGYMGGNVLLAFGVE